MPKQRERELQMVNKLNGPNRFENLTEQKKKKMEQAMLFIICNHPLEKQ